MNKKLDIKDVFTIDGTGYNEDGIGYSDKYLFVLDGATCLTKVNVMDKKSDAKWLTSTIKEKLINEFNKDNNLSTKNILKQIIQDMKEEYINAIKLNNVEVPPDFPSSGLSLFRIRNNKLEFFGLGDCVGVIKFKDGTYKYSIDENLPKLDSQSINKMVKISKEKNITVFEAKKYCMDIILENRMKRNKPNGYWILDLSGEGIDNAREFEFDLDEVDSVYAFSDGFSQLCDTFNEYTNYFDLAQDISTTPIKILAEKLFNLQNKDSDGINFPRFKLRDDTTCGWAKIK